MAHIVAKAANGFTDRGITFFENQNSKRIVYHGADSPTSSETEIAVLREMMCVVELHNEIGQDLLQWSRPLR